MTYLLSYIYVYGAKLKSDHSNNKKVPKKGQTFISEYILTTI